MEVKDQMGRTVSINSPVKKIVSLVPSQTELLHHLGLEEEVVGITKFCIKPENWYRTKTRIGGTKNVNIEIVRSLAPDLIIGNKEENTIEDIELLSSISPIWMSDIYTYEDAIDMIESIGRITDKDAKAKDIISRIDSGFRDLNKSIKNKSKTVAYLIWHEPDMLAGKNTFIDAMLNKCGLVNCTSEERYPEFSKKHSPDLIFLSSEPYPFKDDQVLEFQNKYPEATVVKVDGEMFSWYGSRLINAPGYFKQLLEEIS